MKSENRVPVQYKKGTEDWATEYNMLLDDGVTCDDCGNAERCYERFIAEKEDTSCRFKPNRFRAKEGGANENNF